MKLKKIASLALAGVMAVSMLAGCAGKTNTNTDTNTDVTTPATGVSAKVAAQMTNKVVKLADNATYAGWLSKAIEDADLKAVDLTTDGTVNYNKDAVLKTGDVYTAVATKAELLLNVTTPQQDDNAITFKSADDGSVEEGSENFVLMYTVAGAKSEDVAINTIATTLDKVLKNAKATTKCTSDVYVNHEYNVSVSMQKVTKGDLSAYVVLTVVEHTATKAA